MPTLKNLLQRQAESLFFGEPSVSKAATFPATKFGLRRAEYFFKERALAKITAELEALLRNADQVPWINMDALRDATAKRKVTVDEFYLILRAQNVLAFLEPILPKVLQAFRAKDGQI
ncbi:hypothetical protein AAVH_38910 [Aphelenchoides avenae]|nr:hypothetical protein AAVH_38910 [Aphelenchus avenae]